MRRAFERLCARLRGSRPSSSHAGGDGGGGGVVTHPPNPSLAWPPSAAHSIAYIEGIESISPTVKQASFLSIKDANNTRSATQGPY